MKKYEDYVQECLSLLEKRDGKSAKDSGYSLRDWFKNGGWVQTGGKYDGKPCAKQPGQTTKPYCRDPDDRAALSKKERNKRAAKKRREDPNPDRKGKAKIVTQEEKDACYHKVKARYDVWPSAYASGALSKCRKVGAKNWGNKSKKNEEIELFEGEESLESKIRQALVDEGGAAGMKALQDHTKASEKEIKDAIKGMSDVGLHEDGDYILELQLAPFANDASPSRPVLYKIQKES